MTDQYRDAINEEAGALWAEQVIKSSEISAGLAWQEIASRLPAFVFDAMFGVVHDRVTIYTDPVLFAQSVRELALYVRLTGQAPADPEVFFDFGGE